MGDIETKRRNVGAETRSDDKSFNHRKKKKISILDILAGVTLIVLLCIYVPRAYNLYEEKKQEKEAERLAAITYPKKIEITETDKILIAELMDEYSVGILSDVDPSDGFDDKEKVNYVRHILSEKYSSSGVVAKTAMNNTIKKYFDVEGLDYASLGFKKLNVYEEYETTKVYNMTMLKQYDEAGKIYLAYADCIDKEKVTEGKYKDEDIESKYIFTLKKVIEQSDEDASENDVNTDSNVTDENKKTVSKEKYRYILDKVEQKVEEVKETEKTTKK